MMGTNMQMHGLGNGMQGLGMLHQTQTGHPQGRALLSRPGFDQNGQLRLTYLAIYVTEMQNTVSSKTVHEKLLKEYYE